MKRLAFLLASLFFFSLSCCPGPRSVAPPVIVEFSATPSAISAGDSATLLWNVTGATSVRIDQGIGNVSLAGTRQVSPTTTTAYTMTASNTAGTVSRSVVVTVSTVLPPSESTPSLGAPPVIAGFIADPSEITAGSSTALRWKVIGATSVSIDHGIGNVPEAGMTMVSPTTTTTYALTATNEAGSVTASVQVVVVSTAPVAGLPIVNYFTANPNSITAGGSTTLSWSVSNAASVTIEPGVGTVGFSGSSVVSPTATTTYTLTATNAAGSRTASAQVIVISGYTPPATPSFRVISVTASVSPTSFTGPCPKNFTCSAVITVNTPGTVTYVWERSDGGSSPTQSVTFTTTGSQTVSTGWPRDEAGSYWVRVRTLTPNEVVSNEAHFSLTCQQFAVTSVSLTVEPLIYTGPCPASFICTATITVNGPGTVTYVWERTDGMSPQQTLVFTEAGSKVVTTGWNPPPGYHLLYVHILYPNDMRSNRGDADNRCH